MARPLTPAILLAATVLSGVDTVVAEENAHTLPIFFFHGLNANASFGLDLAANLSTPTRPLVSLNFCENACTFTDLNDQANLAIQQIRGILANDTRFRKGYSFVGHSQGAALARLVIEEMDDHQVHTFISLAGAGHGIFFYGPQKDDFVPAQLFLSQVAPSISEPDFSKYTEADIASGKLMIDTLKFDEKRPELSQQLRRSPNKKVWVKYNPLYPKLNNLDEPTTKEVATQQARRKANFLKLKEAHYFASPFDEVISPWQSSLNGQYEDVDSLAELEAKYTDLKIWSMQETPEYKRDLYGLQTLDKRGGLFLYKVPNVAHDCWTLDALSPRDGTMCKFAPVFAKTIYPLLTPLSSTARTKGLC